VVVAIRERVGLPVKFVGVGESLDDLARFVPEEFVEALFEDVEAEPQESA
jgi:fused signal recognition particle receptor